MEQECTYLADSEVSEADGDQVTNVYMFLEYFHVFFYSSANFDGIQHTLIYSPGLRSASLSRCFSGGRHCGFWLPGVAVV